MASVYENKWRYSEFKLIFEFCLKFLDSSSRFQIPIRIPNDLCWIPVGVGAPVKLQ